MSWQESFRTSIKSMKELQAFFHDSPDHLEALPHHFNESLYPVFLPTNLALKIKKSDVGSSLWKQFIPSKSEIDEGSEPSSDNNIGYNDPIGDQVHQKTKQLIHRYPSRALFLPTNICPVHCRYCFRKNELYTDEKIFTPDFERSIQYLQAHSEINEIVFTGGDPFILSDQKIESYLEVFSQIKHIQFIRFHSRTPVMIPERLTSQLQYIFEKYSSRFHILLSLHINHIDEWSKELEQKIAPFVKNVTLLSQTVLLKSVNDNTDSLCELFKMLSRHKVSPYYLHHPDQAKGTQHFWLSIEEGRRIYQGLRKKLSGWMIPEYILDIPGGHGKSPAYNPESLSSTHQFFDMNGEIRDISSLDKSKHTL